MKLIPKFQNAFGPILYNNFLNILYNIPGIGDEIRKRATRLGIGASKYFNKHTGEFDLPTINIVRPKGSNVSVEQPDALKFRTDASGNFVRVPSGGSNLTDMRGREYHMKLENDAKLIQEAEKQGLAPVFNEDGDIIDFDIPSIAWRRNDRPLSGADPIAQLYVETVALNPIFKGIGNAGKWLWGRLGNTGKAISLGVRKVTTNDGKIFLQLPSHSKKMPRLLRIEPLGDNTFRVHISTWGGITDAEKKELYDALYNTLPENARILFPESSADYLATRGTVAGLKRLGRDPRFTPGKTKQTLMYRDKDGSIKIFEGTDFVKNPNYEAWTPEQWTAAQDAAIARGDMAEAQRLRDLHFNINAPNTLLNGKYYHGSPNTFNEFDESLIGNTDQGWAGRGFYFTPSEEYAAMYGKTRPFYINATKVHEGEGAYYFGRELGPQATMFKKIKIKSGKGDEAEELLNELSSSDAIKASFSQTKPYNGTFEEVVTRNGNQMKLADAVTYDDFGRRIPLGLRDNFNIKDIRFGILPIPFLFSNKE